MIITTLTISPYLFIILYFTLFTPTSLSLPPPILYFQTLQKNHPPTHTHTAAAAISRLLKKGRNQQQQHDVQHSSLVYTLYNRGEGRGVSVRRQATPTSLAFSPPLRVYLPRACERERRRSSPARTYYTLGEGCAATAVHRTRRGMQALDDRRISSFRRRRGYRVHTLLINRFRAWMEQT